MNFAKLNIESLIKVHFVVKTQIRLWVGLMDIEFKEEVQCSLKLMVHEESWGQ